MNFRIAFIILPIFALVLMTSECRASSEASVLFEKAKFTMVTKGDLDGAIKLFSEIIEQHPGDREYAARSQLYIGLCYEKQGKEQARRAYQQVIREYSDQREVAAEAQARLAALDRPVSAPEPKGMVVKKVWTGTDVDLLGAPSPDGRYLSYVDQNTGDLAIYELATGKKRRLTNKGSWDESNEFAEFSRWSPDSKQIVYDWYNEKHVIELRIIRLDGSKPRILYRNEEVEWARTYDWSPDGRQIMAVFEKKDSTFQIVSVSAADRYSRVIKVLGQFYSGNIWWNYWPRNMSLSPDGRYIVYDFPQKEGTLNHDIFLLAADGSREVPLVEHPAHDFVLGWAPDGKRILFASDRNFTLSFWIIQVAEGKPQGSPKLVKPSMGPITPLGFTRKGSFYYGISQARNDIYIAELDPETGEILAPPKMAITRFEGNNFTPSYSPDGKYLAYISRRGVQILYRMRQDGNVLCVRSLETGKDREIFPEGLKSFGYPCWSPDNRSIFVANWEDHNDSTGIYRIDAQTGEVTRVVISEEGGLQGHECSGDGKAIFLVRMDRTKDLYRIVARDLETGIETEIYRASERFSMSRSPDGNRLSLISRSEAGRILKVLPATGGEPRELYKWKQGENVQPFHTWSADGRYILFTKRSIEKPEEEWKYSLWRIPVDGGNPQKLGSNKSIFSSFSIHPDGRHIAFFSLHSLTGGAVLYKEHEVWVMENFLPTE